MPSVRGRVGRPRLRPGKLHADKACDFPLAREALRARNIRPRIARRRLDSSAELGRHRRVVERILAHIDPLRRLSTRYEGWKHPRDAFFTLDCCLLLFSHRSRLCSGISRSTVPVIMG